MTEVFIEKTYGDQFKTRIFSTARRLLAPLMRPLIEHFPPMRMLILRMIKASDILEYRGLKFHVHPKDMGVTFELASTGDYEPLTLTTLLPKIYHGDTIVDIGAHVGLYTVHLSNMVGNVGKVIAFEPYPENVKLLKQNVEENNCSNVEIVPAAIRDVSGLSELRISNYNTGDHSFFGTGNRKTISVPCTTLDNYLPEGTRVDAIKLDVQGGEAEVFRGMKRVIRDNPRMFILWELSPQQLKQYGSDALELLTDIEREGFNLNIVDDATGTIKEHTPEEVIKLCPGKSYVNILSERR